MGSVSKNTHDYRHRFRAMGTTCEIVVRCVRNECSEVDCAKVLLAAESKVRAFERTFTRFDCTSELMRLNHSRTAVVSTRLFLLLEYALEAYRVTNGAFSPFLGRAIRNIGYKQSFELLAKPKVATACASSLNRTHLSQPVCSEQLLLDERTRSARLLGDAEIDLGAVAKGWTADRVVEMLTPYGPSIVNIGGDIAVGASGETPWTIAVDGLGDEAIALSRGAVATSGSDRRRWHSEELQANAHHIIDSRTGLPLESSIVRATCVAETAAYAEIAATAVLTAGGRDEAASQARELGVHCILFDNSGEVYRSKELVA